MNSTSAIALSGMTAAQSALAVAGHNIANAATAGFHRQQLVQQAEPSGGTSVSVETAPQEGASLESDVVGLLEAKNGFLANLAVFKTSDRMTGALLDTLG